MQTSKGAPVPSPSRPTAPAAARPRPAYQRLDGLFDLELRPDPRGGVRAARGAGATLDASQLAELVRRTGGAGDDVRIMMPDAGRHTPIFAELAGMLGRDVLISPAGSAPRSADGGPPGSAFVDEATGRPAPWVVVQPPAMATDLPGWYDTAGGVLRPRAGMVSLPMAGGLMTATRADFVARRSAAAMLMAGHPELTTIGAAVRAGGFLVGDYGGGHEVADGRRFAAMLAALPLYGTEVRMWVTWPADEEEQERLHRNLSRFAETTGAIVWAPDPQAGTEVLDSCRDLGVTAHDGGPGTWHAYPPPAAAEPRFVPDADGRLSPAREPLLRSAGGVSVISVPAGRWRTAHDRYQSLTGRDGLFAVDLTVLADGRWALLYADTDPHVLGPREFQRMLRTAGWEGEDLLLLAHYPDAAARGLRWFGAGLADSLRANVWALPPDGDFEVLDGLARAVDRRGRPLQWNSLGKDRAAWTTEDGCLMPAGDRRRPAVARPLARPVPASSTAPSAPEPVVSPHTLRPVAASGSYTAVSSSPPSPRNEPGPPAAPRPPAVLQPVHEKAAPQPAHAKAVLQPVHEKPEPEPAVREPAVPKPVPEPVMPRPERPATVDASPPAGVSPRLHTAKVKLRHGLYWLADRPRVNAEPVDLFVTCPEEPDRAAAEGLPTPHLFAVGLLRPPASDTSQPGENLLRVRVAEGGAVDLSSIDVHVPPTLQLLLANRGESYLLPAGLLDRVMLLDGWPVRPAGGYSAGERLPEGRTLTLRSSGARHGLDGLPADVPRWPRATDDVAYALLPGPRVTTPGGALALLSAKPRPRPGHRLLRLRVHRRRAIDVRSAAAQLAGLPAVRSRAGELAAAGVELVLPGRQYDKVSVLQVLTPGRVGWRVVPGPGDRPLAEFLDRP